MSAARELKIRRRFHPESAFGEFTAIDGAIMFYARVHELLAPDGIAVDIGCGRGSQQDDPVRIRRELRILRGHCKRVIGIDVDPVGAENPYVDEFRLIADGRTWPVESGSIDLALADFVVEHIPDPDEFFAEAARVIKPGGVICIRTINRNSYLGISSRMIPTGLHRRVLRSAQPSRPEEDVFPTVYRCNTRKLLQRTLEQHGFDAFVGGFEDEPSYLTMTAFTYRLGLLHRRLAPQAIRLGLMALGRRR